MQTSRVELLLAEAVVEPDPGALGDHPGAVAGGNGDRAGSAVAVGRGDVRGRARLQHGEVVPVDQVEECGGITLKVIGVVEDVESVAQHGTLDAYEVLDVEGVPRPERWSSRSRNIAATHT